MSRREFTFVDGKSSKFWAIERKGASFVVQFGRVGTTGQGQTKSFPSEAECRKAYDALIAEKVKKGYVETSAVEASESSGVGKATPKLSKTANAEPKKSKDPAGAPAVSAGNPKATKRAPASRHKKSSEPAFSDEERTLIERIEKSGAELELNDWGWGFRQATDKSLKLISKISVIRSLDLFETCDNNEVSDAGLAEIGRMTDLRSLALGPGFSDAGLAHLKTLGELRVLRLDSAGDVTDEGLQFLKNMKKLQVLSLQYTGVEGPGLNNLAGLKQLAELNLEGTPVPGDVVDSLQKALPKCRILWDPTQVSQKAAKPSVGSKSLLTLRTTLRGSHSDRPFHAAFSPDGKMLATAAGGKVQLWDVTSQARLQRLETKKGASFGIAFTPDGRFVVMGSNLGSFFVWDASSGKLKRTIEAESPIVAGIGINSQGTCVVGGGNDGRVYVGDLSTGKIIKSIEAAAPEALHEVRFSPDGKTLATYGADSYVSLWRFPEGTLLKKLHGPPNQTEYDKIRGIAFHPDGKSLAAAHPDGFIRLWNVSTGKATAAFKSANPVFRLAFHPAGKLLATAGDGDNHLRLLDATSGNTVAELPTNADWDSLSLACFSPDGRTLVTNGKAGSVLLLDVQTSG